MNEADIASANLSRVDCAFCGGRLYTNHKPDCPVPAAQQRDRGVVALAVLDPAASTEAEEQDGLAS